MMLLERYPEDRTQYVSESKNWSIDEMRSAIRIGTLGLIMTARETAHLREADPASPFSAGSPVLDRAPQTFMDAYF